ncbi:hypothetical protein [Methanococcus aeolicus]|nr:hypothetical protein [Methanococcus aeolicus]UXM84351.1 hypothetical protein N6C89_06265 [Methanococcus aeolicus]
MYNDELLKITADNIEHVQVEEMNPMPMIKLKSIKEFIMFAKKCGSGFVCVYNEKESNSGKFFVMVGGVLYWIPNKGYNKLRDYLIGSKQGYNNGNDYYEGKEFGFSKCNEYIKFKEAGFDNTHDYRNAKKLGYLKGLEELEHMGLLYNNTLNECKYINYYGDSGFIEEYDIANNADLYYFAIKNNFEDFEEFKSALLAGFRNANAYKNAYKNGFKTAEEYHLCLEEGFKTAEEYHKSLELGMHSKESLEFYDKLEKIKLKYNLDTFEEALLYDTIFNMPVNGAISIDELWDNLRNNKKIKQVPKERINAILENHDQLKNKSEKIEYTQTWYSKTFEDKDDLKKYILQQEFISSIIKYNENKEIFEKYNMPIFSKRFIIIDTSSITHKYISQLRDIIRELHFEVVTIIPRFKKSSSPIAGTYTILTNSEEGVLNIIINYIKGFGASVITNEKFEEWRKIDRWVSDNIDKYLINYSISEEDIISIDRKEILRLHLTEMIKNKK